MNMMKHATFLANLLVMWLVFQTSAMMLTGKWDVSKFSKQLHDPSKERIDFDCDACVAVVDLVQFLINQNTSVEEIVHGVTAYCIDAKIEDNLVCTQIVREFKVSCSRDYAS